MQGKVGNGPRLLSVEATLSAEKQIGKKYFSCLFPKKRTCAPYLTTAFAAGKKRITFFPDECSTAGLLKKGHRGLSRPSACCTIARWVAQDRTQGLGNLEGSGRRYCEGGRGWFFAYHWPYRRTSGFLRIPRPWQ